MLMLVTTELIKIQGLHPCKDGMEMLLKHVDMISKDAHAKCKENDKSASYAKFQWTTSYRTFATKVRASIRTVTCMKMTLI